MWVKTWSPFLLTHIQIGVWARQGHWNPLEGLTDQVEERERDPVILRPRRPEPQVVSPLTRASEIPAVM